MKAKNFISWAEGITNEIMLLFPIKPMVAVFADTLQSFVATFHRKIKFLKTTHI